MVSEERARRLVEPARAEGVEVFGQSGLLQQMMKSVLEAALNEELTDHLGYGHGHPRRTMTNSGSGGWRSTILVRRDRNQLPAPRVASWW